MKSIFRNASSTPPTHQSHCFWHWLNYEHWDKSPWEIIKRIPNTSSAGVPGREVFSPLTFPPRGVSALLRFLSRTQQGNYQLWSQALPLLAAVKPFDSRLTLWHFLLDSLVCLLSPPPSKLKLILFWQFLRRPLSHGVLQKQVWLRCGLNWLVWTLSRLTEVGKHNLSHTAQGFPFNKNAFAPDSCWKMKWPRQDLRVCHLTPVTEDWPDQRQIQSVATLKNSMPHSATPSSWESILSPMQL